ncbi:Calx-beta domain-containing protein [Halioxenophilus aromaticivorans]|uniref:Calx-beta domain-containing protein n=1 Tax=Halioxenophilus aromaticivorans TaxID=1306992 RepID=A0AAV3U127_9ALTE
MASRISAVVGLAAALSFTSASQAIEFTEVQSSASGLDYVGESWGASWGDFNGDRYPDLFVSNHRARPGVYRNNGDGTFTDIILQFDSTSSWLDFPWADTHAGSFGDFDNNGVQDLLVLSGNRFPAYLFHNKGAGLSVDETVARGFPDDAEGRTATWIDYDNDGELDVIINNRAPNIFVEQTAGNFAVATSYVGLDSRETNFGILSDMDNDNNLEFLSISEGDFPEKVYKTDSIPFLDITSQFPTNGLVLDAAFTDFDNNLVPDILLVRGNLRPNQALKVIDAPAGDVDTVEAWLAGGSSTGTRSVIIPSTNPVTITLYTTQIGNSRVYIGSGGYHPTSSTFTLDPTLASDQGVPVYDETTDQGYYIGYDTVNSQWVIDMSPGSASTRGYLAVEGVDLGDPTVPDLATGDLELEPKLFMNSGTSFVDTNGVGLNVPMSCISLTTGDFDNDMDQDIYIVCRNGIENITNRLFENLGNGTFQEVTSFGAEGAIGAGLPSGAGVGENVVAADYDLDGWLDLFVVNGLLMNPLRVGGPDQLFRNTSGATNTNRYLLLDLKGTVSNRDAIGAKVYITAGGVTQLREMGGNYHRWAQNHQRLHVGLGQNTVADIEVIWPNGETDTFTSVAANDLYEITQGSSGNQTGAIAAVAPTALPSFRDAQPGDECGVRPEDQPDVTFPYHFDPEQDRALFIWKDCAGTGDWFVRSTAGNGNGIQYQGQLVTNAQFSNVAGFSLEDNNDVLDASSPELIDFFMRMSGAGVDGFDFTLADTASACLNMTDMPAGGQVLLGQTHLPISTPINLSTLSTCIDISVDDVLVGEGEGFGQVTVSLSAPSSVAVTVDYAAVSGTAEANIDFASTAGTITFAAGETSKTIAVTITQDAIQEGEETFSVELSNATGAFILDGQGTVTIVDDETCVECGDPAVDRFSEQGIFLWKNFDTGVWSVYVSAGGDPDGVDYSGTISSSAAFNSVVGDSIEANDTLDYITSPDTIDYNLRAWNNAYDAFDFLPAEGSYTCFTPASSPIYVGEDRTPISGAFNLENLQSCTTGITVSDISVSEGAGVANFTVELTQASASTVTVEYSTADGTATGGEDYVAVTTPQVLTFNPGEISKAVAISLIDDSVVEGSESFVLSLSNAVSGTLTNASAQATILDNDVSNASCGEPSYNGATEKALFIWKDCNTGVWKIRSTSGGAGSLVGYEGAVSTTSGFEFVQEVSLESSDLVDSTTDTSKIDFYMEMWRHSYDGFDFKPNVEVGACLTLEDLPVGASILLGANKTQVSTPLDLNTLGACDLPIAVIIGDVEVSERDATADVVVELTGQSSNVVTVEYRTLSGSAEGGLDYVEVELASTLTFNPGDMSKIVTIDLIDDTEFEGEESFSVILENAVNATVEANFAQVTILDDEASPACAAPSYNGAAERALFVWKDCASGVWSVRATSGGAGSLVGYEGEVSTASGFELVQGVSLESSDSVDSIADPSRIDFYMEMWRHSYDGFDFKPIEETGSCLSIGESPDGALILVGESKIEVSSPLDLNTLGPCELPIVLTVVDVEVDESELTATVIAQLSAESTDFVTVAYRTEPGSAEGGLDYVDITSMQTLTFSPGETSKSIVIDIVDDAVYEGEEDFTVVFENPVNVELAATSARVKILDDEVSPACLSPSYNGATEKALFVWKDCATGVWSVRATSGGASSLIAFEGMVDSVSGFESVEEVSLESSDEVDYTTNTSRIDFYMEMWRHSQDGFDFKPVKESESCIYLDSPGNTPILIGEEKLVVTSPVNLNTLQACP